MKLNTDNDAQKLINMMIITGPTYYINLHSIKNHPIPTYRIIKLNISQTPIIQTLS